MYWSLAARPRRNRPTPAAAVRAARCARDSARRCRHPCHFGFLPSQPHQRNCGSQREQRQGQCDHVRVQISIGEGEERELVDGIRNDTRSIPEPPVVGQRQRSLACEHRHHAADGRQQLDQRTLTHAAGPRCANWSISSLTFPKLPMMTTKKTPARPANSDPMRIPWVGASSPGNSVA